MAFTLAWFVTLGSSPIWPSPFRPCSFCHWLFGLWASRHRPQMACLCCLCCLCLSRILHHPCLSRRIWRRHLYLSLLPLWIPSPAFRFSLSSCQAGRKLLLSPLLRRA